MLVSVICWLSECFRRFPWCQHPLLFHSSALPATMLGKVALSISHLSDTQISWFPKSFHSEISIPSCQPLSAVTITSSAASDAGRPACSSKRLPFCCDPPFSHTVPFPVPMRSLSSLIKGAKSSASSSSVLSLVFFWEQSALCNRPWFYFQGDASCLYFWHNQTYLKKFQNGFV